MVENKYLIEWINKNYPMIKITSDIDLCELDYIDFEKFADWLVKKLTITNVNLHSEQLVCDIFKMDSSTSSATKCKCGKEKWEHAN